MNNDQRIAACRTSVSQIYHMLSNAPQTWRNYVDLARSVIVHLDATTYMQQPSNASEQAWMIAGLQQLASSDSDHNLVNDIAAWCSRQWLALLERDPQNVAALRGIGQSWLARAQPVLSRIHHLEGSSSSSGDSSSRSAGSASAPVGGQNANDEATVNATAEEAERRTNTQEYVEARQYLQPATEYLDRAVVAATAQEALSGDLLATTAEAFMSLGNVSSPRINERHFHRALRLLRAAAATPNYSLNRYLQQYLDDYGRLLD